MSEFIVTITGIPSVVSGLQRMQQQAGEIQRDEVRRLGGKYLAVLRAETPIGRGLNPGRMRADYRTTMASTPMGATYRIVNQNMAIGYVVRGRGPVRAIHARALRFVINGVVFFRRSVGPVAPNNFPERAKQAMQGEIAGAGARIAGRIVRAYRGT